MEEFRLMLLWSNLFGFRLLVTMMPQYGLVVKEEFDYPNQVADILGLEQEIVPVMQEKHLLVPYLTSGIPFTILKFFSRQKLFEGIISPYSVLMVPRLWMTVCSLTIDLFIFKIASNVGCSRKSGLIAMTLFSGSYVTWVYLARTLPIAFNTILYALLLYVITSNLSIQNDDNSAKVGVGTSFLIGFCMLLGVHVDVTFLDFSASPVLLWLCYPQFSVKILSKKLVSLFTMSWFLFGAVILMDMNNDTMNGANLNKFNFHELSSYQYPLKCINGIAPHLDSFRNIASKLVYIFSLLLTLIGPLMIPLSKIPRSIILNEECAQVKRSQSVLICSIASALSAFILMKERDYNSILPLIIPAVILVAKYEGVSRKLVICYGVFNSFAFTYNGTYKYSGAVHGMSFLGAMVEPMKHYRVSDIVFYETPILPKYLLAMQCDYDPAHEQCMTLDYLDLRFIDSNSETLPEILDMLLNNKPDYSVLLALPGSVPCSFISKINSMFTLQLFYRCFPHVISLEHVPDYSHPREWCRIRGGYFEFFSDLIYEKFSLNIYAVGRQKPATTNNVENTEKLTVVIHKYSSTV